MLIMENLIDSNKNQTNCCKQNGKLINDNNNDPCLSDAHSNVIKLNGAFDMSQQQEKNRSREDNEEADSCEAVFHNEGLIEEIILLPNNLIVSDDDASTNSDDCVYAYRGGQNINSPEPVAISNDDETDFLEMDFDPEPNSELENFDDEHFNHLESNFFSLPRENEEENVSLNQSNCVDPSMVLKDVSKNTGAKPKTRQISSNSVTPQNLNEPVQDVEIKLNGTHSSDIGSCLDCAEADFIRQTKPEIKLEHTCPTHTKKDKSENSFDIFTDPLMSSLSIQPTQQENQLNEKIKNPQYENMVTIYSVNSDYETIVEAANLIGLPLKTDILRQYFEISSIEKDTATMDIPEYLLFTSKRNCNYKKLMELIRSSSLEPVDIHFYPHDPISNTIDVVQINASELIKRWQPSTDLRQILKFKNRHFRLMNVLGKVVNVIRNAERCKNLNVTINIPQYYKSGYICITKSSFQPWS